MHQFILQNTLSCNCYLKELVGEFTDVISRLHRIIIWSWFYHVSDKK